jgi:glucose-6-phosphate 1-dehydrogenase
MNGPRSDALVLFGSSGDLARKKLLPTVYRLAARGRLGVPVVGVAASEWTDDRFRAEALAAADAAGERVDDAVAEDVARSLTFVSGDYREPSLYRRLAERLASHRRPLFYLAIPPALFEDVVGGLATVGLHHDARVVVEKPFGRDLVSARALNEHLHAAFPETSIFRIDHFLGKEAVQNLLVFRFANSIFEPLWNRDHIACVQVTMAEDFGVEGRGAFYDQVGTLRDVVQNHLLQLVALLAMEPPVSDDADALRDEKVKVLRAIRPLDPDQVVRAQYADYRREPGVAPDSQVETYVALRAEIDSWRWAGVPFFIRAGKALASTVTEAVVEFRSPPRLLFAPDCGEPRPNQLRLRFKPDDDITLRLQAKAAGSRLRSRPLDLSMSETGGGKSGPEAYEQLIDDAMDGDPGRFARQDGVEAAWRVVEPVLNRPGAVQSYGRGTWGPEGAGRLVSAHGGWQPCEGPLT